MDNLNQFGVVELNTYSKMNIDGGVSGGDVAEKLGYAIGFTIGSLVVVAVAVVETVKQLIS